MQRKLLDMGACGRSSLRMPGVDHATDVAIVGGGMVGLTLAAALGHAGVGVALLDAQEAEARTAPGYDGRSSAVAYGSQQVLEGIAVWRRLLGAAQPILDIRVSDGNPGRRASRFFLHYDHRELPRSVGASGVPAVPLGYIVENQAIRAALLASVAALPTVATLAPARVAEVVRYPTGVELTLADGGRVRARLIVGADGARSGVRAEAGIAVSRWIYPQTSLVCSVLHEHPHHGVAHEHFLPAGPFAMLPMVPLLGEAGARHRSSIVWTEHSRLAPALLSLDDAAFSAEIQRRFGDSLGRIEILGRRWTYPLHLLHAERYIGHRLALIGDAAHVIHPIAGQGLNLGLRDVAALAETLVDAHRLGLDLGGATVLDRYQRWRRFDNLVLIAVTDGLNRLFSNDMAPVRLARDLGLAVVDRVPGLKQFLMRHAMGMVGDLPRLVRGQPL